MTHQEWCFHHHRVNHALCGSLNRYHSYRLNKKLAIKRQLRHHKRTGSSFGVTLGNESIGSETYLKAEGSIRSVRVVTSVHRIQGLVVVKTGWSFAGSLQCIVTALTVAIGIGFRDASIVPDFVVVWRSLCCRGNRRTVLIN